MTTYNLTKRQLWIFFTTAALIFATLLPAQSAEPSLSSLTEPGTWEGTIETGGRDIIPVELKISPTTEQDVVDYSLHFGPPRNCELKATFLQSKNDIHSFRFNEANGGFCDKLHNDTMDLEPIKATVIRITISRNNINEQTTITRSR